MIQSWKELHTSYIYFTDEEMYIYAYTHIYIYHTHLHLRTHTSLNMQFFWSQSSFFSIVTGTTYNSRINVSTQCNQCFRLFGYVQNSMQSTTGGIKMNKILFQVSRSLLCNTGHLNSKWASLVLQWRHNVSWKLTGRNDVQLDWFWLELACRQRWGGKGTRNEGIRS